MGLRESPRAKFHHSRDVESVDCDNGSSLRADVFILATGIESAPIGRSLGVNIPVYPMRGNILTIPLKVRDISIWSKSF